MEFVVDEGQTTIRPAGAPENPFLKYLRALPAFSDTDQINAWERAMREDGDRHQRSLCTVVQRKLAADVAKKLGNAKIEGGLVIGASVYAELLAHPKAT